MTKSELLPVLSTISPFSLAAKEHLRELVESEGCSLLALTKKSAPAREPCRNVSVLLAGRAEIVSSSAEKPVILRTLSPLAVFGAASVFCKEELPETALVAKEDVLLCLFSKEAIFTLLTKDTAFLAAYLSLLAGRVAFLNRKILCFTAGSAEKKLALYLLSEKENTLSLPHSVSSLSDALGIARASLYRALDLFAAEGLIAREGRKIHILDRAALAEKYTENSASRIF